MFSLMVLSGMAHELPIFASLSEAVEGDDGRRIGKGPPPPPHRPTVAVPPGLLQSVPNDLRRLCQETAKSTVKALTTSLGRPFYSNDGFVLYNCDCRNLLRALADVGQAVDLTVTSPPYNIGKEYEAPLSLEEYRDWCAEWLRLVHVATGPKGALWLNLGYVRVRNRGRAVPLPYLLWDQVDFFLQQEVVWQYGAGVAAKQFFAPRNEKWLFYTAREDEYVFNLDDVRDPNVKYPNQKKNGKYRCNPLGKNPGDVWHVPKVTTGKKRSSRERTSHPAQFPLAVVDRIVKVSSNYGDLVVDPFSGSGSAGIAAVGNGRVFVGSELRRDYCVEAAKRHARFIELRDSANGQLELSLDAW